jgi:hypothetical protein
MLWEFNQISIDVKQSSTTFNKKYNFVETMKCDVQKLQV